MAFFRQDCTQKSWSNWHLLVAIFQWLWVIGRVLRVNSPQTASRAGSGHSRGGSVSVDDCTVTVHDKPVVVINPAPFTQNIPCVQGCPGCGLRTFHPYNCPVQVLLGCYLHLLLDPHVLKGFVPHTVHLKSKLPFYNTLTKVILKWLQHSMKTHTTVYSQFCHRRIV